MRFKSLLVYSCLLISGMGFSQIQDSCSSENSQYIDSIIAFIKGKKGEKEIKYSFFHEKFELELSDSSYKIASFRIVCDNPNKNYISERTIQGNVLTPDLGSSDISSKKEYSLKSVEPGNLITFENIFVRKDGKCFKARPIIIYTTL